MNGMNISLNLKSVALAILAMACCKLYKPQWFSIAYAKQANQIEPRAFSIAPVVEKVMNGVVNIRTSDTATSLTQKNVPDDFFTLFMGTANSLEKTSSGSRSLGSGFFYSNNKLIVTNYHVIKDASTVVVFATDLNVYRQASVVGKDPAMDLALLQVRDVPNARPLEFGSSEKMRPGDGVFAIGNPYGYGNTVTSGILSAKGRSVGGGALAYLLQTDVPLNPGNSGGPLFNLDGKVVGINSANVTDAQGISFAIPAELAKRRLQGMLSSGGEGVPAQAWLGFLAEDIFDNPEFSPESYGVSVREVVKGSPAYQAGIRVGDVVRKINNVNVSHLGKLEKEVTLLEVGKKISIEVYRSGKNIRLNFATLQRPEKYFAAQNTSHL